MNEVHHQLASALLTLVFAAVMFMVGHLYIENRSTRIPTAQAFMPWTSPLVNSQASSILVRMHQTFAATSPLSLSDDLSQHELDESIESDGPNRHPPVRVHGSG
jgi:hypothetical protein